LARNIVVCPSVEMIDRLSSYAESGIDELILNVNIGASQDEAIEAMHRFAEEVSPHVGAARLRVA